MADRANKALEELIPGLEYFQSSQIFTPREIRTIVKRRRYFEYKTRRHAPDKKDFLRYVDYEMSLGQLRGLREQQHNISPLYRAKADAMAFKHIKNIFLRALHRFGADKSLWHSYIDFGVAAGFRKALGYAFTRALQLHPKEPSFWLKASHWEYTQNSNIIAARALLQRSLRFLPDNASLREAFFKMEILYLKDVQQSVEAAPDALGAIQLPQSEFALTPFMQGAIPRAILLNSLQTIPTQVFALAMLDIYHECHSAQTELELEIVRHLLTPPLVDLPDTWNGLAHRATHLNRKVTGQALEALGYKLAKSSGLHLTPEEIWTFASAHIKTAEIWWLHAQMFPDRVRELGKEMKKLDIVPLKQFYQLWIESLRANQQSPATILKESLSHYPEHLKFIEWSLEGRTLSAKDARAFVDSYKSSTSTLRAALYQIVLGHVAPGDFPSLLKELLLKQLGSDRAVDVTALKEWAVEHIVGWPAAERRPVVQMLLNLPGTPAGLYVLLSQQERQFDPSYARQLLQQALRQHGDDEELWEEAISFEYEQSNIPAANLLFQRAKAALKDPDAFLARHSLRFSKH